MTIKTKKEMKQIEAFHAETNREIFREMVIEKFNYIIGELANFAFELDDLRMIETKYAELHRFISGEYPPDYKKRTYEEWLRSNGNSCEDDNDNDNDDDELCPFI